jgi:hypothetical protein
MKYGRWLRRKPIQSSERYLEHVEKKINGMKCGQNPKAEKEKAVCNTVPALLTYKLPAQCYTLWRAYVVHYRELL